MTINAQEFSPEVEVQITFRTKVFNSNKNKPIQLTEERIKQRIQTVLYPLTAIDKKYDLVWYINVKPMEEPTMEVTLDDLQ